ncbi:MAG TPA: chemotaxis protein CheA [Aeromonadales bacterium]|nr:chemotaxis protein CheA [Aeromonadales bacterium]
MSIDLSQFHQIFFEESFEGLDVMEQELIALEPDSVDLENINTIFRAAHSIKGGSGTFGFNEVADFTHVLESLLDEMRTGERNVTREAIDLLLKTVDVLRDMLLALQSGESIDDNAKNNCHSALQQMLAGESANEPLSASADQTPLAPTKAPTKEDSNDSSQSASSGWKISFSPEPHILLTGNEPARMFRELALLGTLKVECFTEKLPTFNELNPEQLFLCWQLQLETDSERADIDEVFEWVVDDCKLTVESLSASDNEKVEEPGLKEETAVKATEPSIEAATTTDQALVKSKTTTVKKTAKESRKVASPNRSIRVDIQKVDNLINRVGELVITQSMLAELGEKITPESIEKLRAGLTELEQNTRELQESVMSIRMMPISFAFNRFPRLVRDVSAQIGKDVELVITGENTELDKTVMEQISDPLVHIVRNSLDHGLELPEERIASGKDAKGTLTLDAYHQGGEIIIEVRDDGRGLNREKIIQKALEKQLITEDEELTDQQVWHLIFLPGFSTADAVSDLSGRGVGMDVVKRNITSLGGTVDIESVENAGTKLKIRLPLTLAILDGQLIEIAGEIFVVPLISMIESLPIELDAIKTFGKTGEMYQLREAFIPIVKLDQQFSIPSTNHNYHNQLLLVVESDGEQIGLVIDELLAQQQVVIKNLDTNFRTVDGISGATILGNGRVALIVDVSGIRKRKKQKKYLSQDALQNVS